MCFQNLTFSLRVNKEIPKKRVILILKRHFLDFGLYFSVTGMGSRIYWTSSSIDHRCRINIEVAMDRLEDDAEPQKNNDKSTLKILFHYACNLRFLANRKYKKNIHAMANTTGSFFSFMNAKFKIIIIQFVVSLQKQMLENNLNAFEYKYKTVNT